MDGGRRGGEEVILWNSPNKESAAKHKGQSRERTESTTSSILSIVKQITSPGGMHETSAQTWCTGKTQRDQVERVVGGGIGMGNTCNSMADSCQCMTKPKEML